MGHGVSINIYLWCAAGAAIGWLGVGLMGGGIRTVYIENVLVGMFGAVIGGDVVSANFLPAAAASGFSFPALGAAIACAVVGVVLLGLMRRSVGPSKPSRSRKRDR